MDDRFASEEWDPSEYEPPDLSSGLRNARPSVLSDRDNACIHYALQGFLSLISEHELSIGRELTAAEKFRHISRFQGHLFRKYGATAPNPAWLARHESWHSRHGGG